MPKLRYFSNSGKWECYELGEHTRIGRHPEQDLQLMDRLISKEHAEITLKNGVYVIRDIGSRNGTTVNDELLDGPHVLQYGDDIGIGNHILTFVESEKDFEVKPREEECKTTQVSQEEIQKCLELVQGMPPIRKHVSEDAKFLPEHLIESQKDLRQDYEKLRVAAELSAEAATTVDLDRLLEIIVYKAFEIFHADRAAILLADENGKMHTRIAMNSEHQPIENFKFSETLLEEVVAEKTAVLSGDMLEDTRFSSSHSLVLDNVRSTMCVPLMYEKKVLGVINLDTQLMKGAFNKKDLQILTGFARQVAFSIQQAHMIEESKRNVIIRENLSRIISPHLINDVMSGKIELQKSGALTHATVLFADIRGFTRLTEQSSPEVIVKLLNDFFERMVECIFRHDGVLDKFVGDQVMAVWGVGFSREEHAQKAAECAIDMMNALTKINLDRMQHNLPLYNIGIGIATGDMIAGYMGSTQAMSYTVIGDTVNLGARLCSAADAGQILISEETYQELKDDIEVDQLTPILVKGKRHPVEVYSVRRPPEEFNFFGIAGLSTD